MLKLLTVPIIPGSRGRRGWGVAGDGIFILNREYLVTCIDVACHVL